MAPFDLFNNNSPEQPSHSKDGVQNLIDIIDRNNFSNINKNELLNYLRQYHEILNAQNDLIQRLRSTKLKSNVVGATPNTDRNTVLEIMKSRQRDMMKSISKIKPPTQITPADTINFVPFPDEPPFPVLPSVPGYLPNQHVVPQPGPPPRVPNNRPGTNMPPDPNNPLGPPPQVQNNPPSPPPDPPPVPDNSPMTSLNPGSNPNPDNNLDNNTNLNSPSEPDTGADGDGGNGDGGNGDGGNGDNNNNDNDNNNSAIEVLNGRDINMGDGSIDSNTNLEGVDSSSPDLPLLPLPGTGPGGLGGPTGPGGLGGPTGPGGLGGPGGPTGPGGFTPDPFYARNRRGSFSSNSTTNNNTSSNSSNSNSNNNSSSNSDSNNSTNSNNSRNSNNSSGNSSSNIFSDDEGKIRAKTSSVSSNRNSNNDLDSNSSSINFGKSNRNAAATAATAAKNLKLDKKENRDNKNEASTKEKPKTMMEAATTNPKNNANEILETLLGDNTNKNNKNKNKKQSISSDILSFNSTSNNIKNFSKLPSVNDNTNNKNVKDFSPNTSSNIFSANTKKQINELQKNKTEEKNNDNTEVLNEISEYENSAFNKIKKKIQSLTSKSQKNENTNGKKEENNNNEIIEANNNNLKPNNTFKKNESTKTLYETVEPLIEETDSKMEALNKKFNQKIVLNLDLEYENLNPDLLIEIVNNTLRFMPKNNVIEPRKIQTAGGAVKINNRYEDLLKLENVLELNPKVNISKEGEKTKIIIDNLSNKDYRKLTKFQSRVEEYVTNRYLDKLEDIDSTHEAIEKYENIKYFKKQDDNDVDFFDGEGRKITLIQMKNRIINVTRIKNETKIEFCKLLEPIPPEVEKKASFLNHLKSGTSATLSKIKNSFGKLIPSFDFKFKKDVEDKNELVVDNQLAEPNKVVEEPLEEPIEEKTVRKRTLKNSYTFHQLPGTRPIKNSTVKITKKRLNSKNNKSKNNKSKNKKSKENTEKKKKIKKKVKKQKPAKLVKKKIKREKNHESFHKIRKR